MLSSLRLGIKSGFCSRQNSDQWLGVSARLLKTVSWAVALTALGAIQWTSVASAKISVVFGTYSADKPTAMVTQLRPSLDGIAKRMSEITGEEVEVLLQVVGSYDAGVDLIVNGDVDFMRLGPASYVAAKNRNSGLHILALENKHGKKTFNGIIAVQTDSNLTEVSQLRGRSFAFGSKRSTLGRYFSQLHLMRSGVFARDLARFQYLGRHDKVGRAVGSGLYDAGALESTTFDKLVAKGVPIRAIATFSNVTRPWVARAGLAENVEAALRQALISLTDPDALAALRFDGFFLGDDSEFDPTREAIKENPRFFSQLSSTQ